MRSVLEEYWSFQKTKKKTKQKETKELDKYFPIWTGKFRVTSTSFYHMPLSETLLGKLMLLLVQTKDILDVGFM